jgi:hypothetical protein
MPPLPILPGVPGNFRVNGKGFLPRTLSKPRKRFMDTAENGRRRKVSTFALLVILSLAIRLYPALSAVNLTPDAVEYLDLARHSSRGDFGTASIKRHYMDGYPVVYNGTGLRPPLFPIAAGGVLALLGTVTAVQACNALAASLAVGFWYLAFAALFSWRSAAGGALAATFSIWFWGSSVIALTEPLSMLLTGLICWVVASGRWRTLPGSAGLGALCALAYLTRHANVIFVPLVLGLWALETARGKTGKDRLRLAVRCLPALIAGAAVLTPFAVKNARDFGSPFYDPNRIVFRGGEETFDHFSARPPETLLEYSRQKGAPHLVKAVARGAQRNLKAVTTGPGGLGLMCLALPLLALQLFYVRQPEGVWFLTALVLLNFTAYSLVNFHGYDDPRFILLSTFPLYPLCLHSVEKMPWLKGKGPKGSGRRRDFRGIVVALLVAASVLQGVLVFALKIRKIPACTIAETPSRIFPAALLRHEPETYDSLFLEITRNAGPGTIVATGLPWLVNFYTGLPTALLPVDLTAETFPVFLDRYHVHMVVLDPASLGEERHLRYEGILRALAKKGVGRVIEDEPFFYYCAK